MFDNFTKNKIVMMTHASTVSADTNSGSVDRLGFESCSVYVDIGVDAALDGSNHWACHLEESDDDTNWSDVADADVIGSNTNAFGTVNSTAEDAAVYGLGYNGNKRYVRAVLDETGTLSGPVAVFAVLSDAHVQPTTQAVNP